MAFNQILVKFLHLMGFLWRQDMWDGSKPMA